MDIQQEIARRRTFAIIAHPDAGKTTLTEKMLLFGGAIHTAGAVKSNKIRKAATSDFMEIEKQRGISVATSVMGFDYRHLKINILDTPGHQDFAEDTYRTLTAVDSVIVVIDAAKGVEPQTLKLMDVCRMRKTPVIVFVNKLDRTGLDPFDLMDEIEQQLHIRTCPMTWPLGSGPAFKGVYNLHENNIQLFTTSDKQTAGETIHTDIHSSTFNTLAGKSAPALREDIDMAQQIYPPFNRAEYRAAHQAPVFFGSALNNFGIRELLNCFIDIAPPPRSFEADERTVHPHEHAMSGFIFKIHANMDPSHRDRIAFLRICAGTFRRNTGYLHARTGKTLKFANPTSFMADKKSIVDEAFAGDIVGIYDTGNFKIGDTLTEGEHLHFRGIPSFSPELFRYVENASPIRYKQLAKGLEQLTDEGVAQLFTSRANGRKIIGTVGILQFDVIQYRLEHEYGASCTYQPLQLHKACWIEGDSRIIDDFRRRKWQYMAIDKDGRDVFMAESGYALSASQEKYPGIRFHFTSEF